MGQPFVGECRMVGFNFGPVNWMICQGQVLAISSNTALYTLIGTTYGGDGQTTFQLPNLQGRVPLHQGSSFVIGQPGGSETVTLATQHLPSHNHPLFGSSVNGVANNLQGTVLAGCATPVYVASPNPAEAMSASAVTSVGGSQPHDNRQPYLALNWIISLFGVFPSQS
jgi:microcystin-dependent protein